jgi:hypothetical protein
MSYSPNSNSVNELLQGLEKADDTSFYPPEETIHDVMKGQSPGQHDAIEGERAAKKEQQRLDYIKTMQGKPMDKDDVLHGDGDNKTRRAQNEMAEIRKKEKARKKEYLANYIVNPHDLLNWGIKALEELNITELLINNQSEIPGKIELSYESPITPQFEFGFNPPSNYKTYRPITCTGQSVHGINFIQYLTDYLDDQNGYNEDYKKQWLDFLAGKAKNGDLANMIKSYGYGNMRTKSLSGTHHAHKVIPPIDWFLARVRKINVVDELLSLWEAPEREALALMIGRAVAGASFQASDKQDTADLKSAIGKTTRVLEGFQDATTGQYIPGGMKHTTRSIPVLCGAAGVGKSHFMDNLKSAVDKLGFTSGIVPLSGNQFGWGAAKSADMMFADDTSQEDFAALFKASQTKTIASGGDFADEDKGVNVKMSRAVSSMFIATNHVFIPSRDSGMASRVEFLQVRNKVTLTQRYNGLTYEGYLKEIAKKHNTTVDVLFMYLCRMCFNKFIDCIGYKYNTATGQYDNVASSNLENRLKELREMFIYQGKVDAENMLIEACIKVQAMNSKLEKMGLLKNYPNKQNPNPRVKDNYSITVEHVVQLAETVGALTSKCESMKLPNSDTFLPHIVNNEDAINYHDTLQRIIDWILPQSKFDHTTLLNFCNAVKLDISNSGASVNKHDLWNKHISECATFYNNCSKNKAFYKNHWDSTLTDKPTYETELLELLRESNLTAVALSTIAKAVSVFTTIGRPLTKEELHDIELEKYFRDKKRRSKLIQDMTKQKALEMTNGHLSPKELAAIEAEESTPKYIDLDDPNLADLVAEAGDYTPEQIAEVKEFKKQNTTNGSGTNGNSGRKGFAMKNRVAQAPIQGF